MTFYFTFYIYFNHQYDVEIFKIPASVIPTSRQRRLPFGLFYFRIYGEPNVPSPDSIPTLASRYKTGRTAYWPKPESVEAKFPNVATANAMRE